MNSEKYLSVIIYVVGLSILAGIGWFTLDRMVFARNDPCRTPNVNFLMCIDQNSDESK